MFRSFVFLSFLAPLCIQAQLMEWSGGTMHIQEGTRLSIEGPLAWRLAPDGILINDGTIDFGPEATVEEPLGAAIVGMGVESTTRTFTTAVAGNEPAGLGLRMSAASPIGSFTLVRGHGPFTLSTGAMGIARWFQLITNDQPGAILDVTLRYDPSELNGLAASSLDLYTSEDPDDFWTPRSGEATGDPWTITAGIFWPWSHITAFEADATTSITEHATDGFKAWPTVTSGTLQLEAVGNERIMSWELRDASGRLHKGERHGEPGAQYRTIDLAPYSTGLYFLRINGNIVIKLLKQ